MNETRRQSNCVYIKIYIYVLAISPLLHLISAKTNQLSSLPTACLKHEILKAFMTYRCTDVITVMSLQAHNYYYIIYLRVRSSVASRGFDIVKSRCLNTQLKLSLVEIKSFC